MFYEVDNKCTLWYNVKDQPQSRKAVITSRDDLMEDGVETKGNGRATRVSEITQFFFRSLEVRTIGETSCIGQ